jgi:hypothetical protein
MMFVVVFPLSPSMVDFVRVDDVVVGVGDFRIQRVKLPTGTIDDR